MTISRPASYKKALRKNTANVSSTYFAMPGFPGPGPRYNLGEGPLQFLWHSVFKHWLRFFSEGAVDLGVVAHAQKKSFSRSPVEKADFGIVTLRIHVRIARGMLCNPHLGRVWPSRSLPPPRSRKRQPTSVAVCSVFVPAKKDEATARLQAVVEKW